MIVRYNQLNRLETPALTLCNPGSVYHNGELSNMVGVLTDHEAEEIIFNFNATSELNFRINKVDREDPDENAYVQRMYQSVQNRRLVFVEDIGYFMISNIDDGFDGVKHYKDVKAKSIDVELAQKIIPYIEDGTYPFMTDATTKNKGIFEIIVESLPLWTIDEVDETVASKWRTFTDLDSSLNCLSFLLQNCQDAFECIFVFDPIHRRISVYSQDNYVRRTNIHITKHDLVNSLDITENADDLYTAISVMGDGDVTVSAINPLGSNVIYNFDYYLSWMPKALGDKVAAWQDAVKAEKNNYYTLNLGYFKQFEAVSTYELKIQDIDTQIKMYQRCRDNIVASSDTTSVEEYNEEIIENGGEAIVISDQVDATIEHIDGLIKTCEKDRADVQIYLDDAKKKMDEYSSSIKEITDRLAIKSCFTEEEYTELCLYIFEGNYTDEYVILTEGMTYEDKFEQMKILYDRAEAQLNKASKPTQQFNIDVENFLFSKEFEQWSEQLETGCLINVELEVDDVAALFLSNMTVNYDDHKLTMTFGNRFNKFDPKSLFDDVLGNITKTANTLTYIKDILYPIKNGEFDSLKEALATSRSLTMGQALSSVNEEVVIDGSGYTGRKKLSDGTYDAHQIKITGKNIVFTNDSWDTCKVAIGSLVLGDGTSAYGINAETIWGDMIIGGGLKIFDNNGNELLSVIDGIQTRVANSEGDITSLTQTIDGFTFTVSDNSGDSAKLTLKSGEAVLASATITMAGLVTFTDLSTVNGKTTIHGGNIQTGTITAECISSDFISALNLSANQITSGVLKSVNYVSGSSGTSINLADGVIDTAKFKVNSNGLITAKGGTLGGWTFDDNLFYKQEGYYAIGIAFNDIGQDSRCFGIGQFDPTSGSWGDNLYFSITGKGKLVAKEAEINGVLTAGVGSSIGGFSVDSNSVYSGSWGSSAPDVFISTGTNMPYTIAGKETNGWVFGAGSTFGVTKSGGLYCTGGKIGGWNISSDGLMCGSDMSDDGGVYFKGLYLSIAKPNSPWQDIPWATVYDYIVDGQSDFNVKNSVSNIDNYDILFDNLKPCRYKYNHGNSNRFHTGFIAQEVVSAIECSGLTTQDFAGVMHLEEPDTNGCEWLLRRDEFVALNTWQIQKAKCRIAELESKVKDLESIIESLPK